MKIVSENSPLKLKADLLVYLTTNGKTQSHLTTLNTKLGGELKKILKKEEFKGEKGQSKLIFTKAKLKADNLLIIGLGSEKSLKSETLRNAGASAFSTAKRLKASKVVVIYDDFAKTINYNDTAQSFCEGVLLGQYSFTRYLKASKNPVSEIRIASTAKHQAKTRSGIKLAQTLAPGVCLARDLVNTPGGDMTPAALVKEARKIKGVRTRIHNTAAIKKMKMGAFLSVAQGSTANPAYFIEMHYTPTTKPKKKIAIVGKGVTFDTGGYSLKPPKAMENMKDDMAASAAVIGLMSIITKLKPKVAVSGYIAATENMVDGHAQRPGDVCKAMNGKTIEVLNTDAEGRLTLADALHYAISKKPDYVVDMATLTGACLVALGMRYTAIMGNDQKLIDKLRSSGDACGENLWQLPLAPEYRDELKSSIADLKNIAGPYAGSITAGLFLENFVGKAKWAHLDIAGPSWTDANLPYIPRGGTGVMVRTLAHFLAGF